jgi:dCTP deaminase
MALLSDRQIISLSDPTKGLKEDSTIHRMMASIEPMIEPFSPVSVSVDENGKKIPSYGVSSYGYDIRLGNEFKVFTNVNTTVIDPMDFDEKNFVEMHKEDGDFIIIPPNSFILAVSKEYIRVPREVLVTCLGKSTYARCGIYCNVTPLEPEWEGQITLEFCNSTPIPAKMYVGAGCAQLQFHTGDIVCDVSYKDRGGKYQGQRGVTLPK